MPLVDLWKYIINSSLFRRAPTRGDRSGQTRTEPTAGGIDAFVAAAQGTEFQT